MNNLTNPTKNEVPDKRDGTSRIKDTNPNFKSLSRSPEEGKSFVYRDLANVPLTQIDSSYFNCHDEVPPQPLQDQKLPQRLAAILSDANMTNLITWMPHGRSWKVLDREQFCAIALPRYFGHSNYQSFVRIVNAWGFRRVVEGPDRDSYYHEMFLRGKPELHKRMKRLTARHRKAPVDEQNRCPNFYEIALRSPLPEVPLTPSSDPTARAITKTNLAASMQDLIGASPTLETSFLKAGVQKTEHSIGECSSSNAHSNVNYVFKRALLIDQLLLSRNAPAMNGLQRNNSFVGSFATNESNSRQFQFDAMLQLVQLKAINNQISMQLQSELRRFTSRPDTIDILSRTRHLVPNIAFLGARDPTQENKSGLDQNVRDLFQIFSSARRNNSHMFNGGF